MDSAFEKVGLYDFFGVFLTGILVVMIGSCLNLPLTPFGKDTGNELINVILFLLGSYFVGMVLQEVGSFLDKNFLKIRKNTHSKFLNSNNKIFENDLELETFKKIANEILEKPDHGQNYTPNENEYVFFHCKTYLEVKGKMDKADRINSIYGMSRSLTVSLLLFLLLCFIYNVKFWPTMLILILLIVLFSWRAKRFSEYYVRIILRSYRIAKTSL